MKVKEIHYAYPSSGYADEFGFKNGCFVVEVGEEFEVKDAIKGFSTLEQAMEFGETLTEIPWGNFSLNKYYNKVTQEEIDAENRKYAMTMFTGNTFN